MERVTDRRPSIYPIAAGRITAGKDDMGGSAASRLSGTSITVGGATTLGGSGGNETKTLITANLPAYTPSGSVTSTLSNGSLVVQAGSGQQYGTGADLRQIRP